MFASFLGKSSSSTREIDDTQNPLLNEYLELLYEVFPDVDVDELRDRLASYPEESLLYLVTESLIRNPSGGGARRRGGLAREDKFRSKEYQKTVKNLLYPEFKGLSKSTINAVLAENNYDYRRTRATLVEIASKSWRFTVSAFFRRRKIEIPAQPEIRITGCAELDDELREYEKDKIAKQIEEDAKISAILDEAEHAAASELVECETCYGDYSWNQTAVCTEGHFICYGCLTNCAKESLYGQGQNIISEKASIKCSSAAASPTCTACIPHEILEMALPKDLLKAMYQKSISENLDRCGLELIRCPFCEYAEVDEVQQYHIKNTIKVLGSTFALLALLFPVFLNVALSAVIFLVTVYYFFPAMSGRTDSSPSSLSSSSWSPRVQWTRAVRRVQIQRRGSRFRCQNVDCKRESCISCSKEWQPFHKCFEKEADSARLYVEKAMANAVKRTCPVCRISFVKSDGCNKLTCPCGYIMCYICRADIRTDGYRHFCQHFRQVPGTPCEECDSCDLYATENEDEVIKEAARKAELEYFKEHGLPPSWAKTKVGVGMEQELGDNSGLIDWNLLRNAFDGIVSFLVEELD